MSDKMSDIIDEMLKVEGADKFSPKDYEYISTGHAGINYALTGDIYKGIPLGCIIEIFGAEGLGKSTLTYSLISQAQKLNYITLLIDIEGSFNTSQAERNKIDISKLITCKYKDLKNIVKFICAFGRKCREKGLKGIIVWDSYAATKLDDKSSKGGMAEEARIMSASMKEFLEIFTNSDISLIIINQMRDNMRSPFFVTYVQPGGWALKHGPQLRIELKKAGEASKLSKLVDDTEGKVVNFNVVKSKFYIPQSCQFILLYKHGIDWELSLMSELIVRNVIKSDGGWYEWNGKKYRRVELWKTLKSNEGLRQEFEEKLQEVIKF